MTPHLLAAQSPCPPLRKAVAVPSSFSFRSTKTSTPLPPSPHHRPCHTSHLPHLWCHARIPATSRSQWTCTIASLHRHPLGCRELRRLAATSAHHIPASEGHGLLPWDIEETRLSQTVFEISVINLPEIFSFLSNINLVKIYSNSVKILLKKQPKNTKILMILVFSAPTGKS